ncbi:hypothetical protein ABPG77_008129 [Micractinium sp. CCAP 211/92]
MAANDVSDDPSSHAPVVAFPDFRLFDSAQDILDHNKRIIKEIKANHEAQTPEALARNCVLIRELNTNISAVMQAYSSISESFERYMTGQQQQRSSQQQQQAGDGSGNDQTGAAAERQATSDAAAAAAVPQVPA